MTRKIGCYRLTIVVVLGTASMMAQDKAAVTAPNGITFAEFAGYETWEVIAPSLPKDGIKVILGNRAMIQAHKDGIVANGHRVPDGAMMAKVAWSAKDNLLSPGAGRVPDRLRKVQFMIKSTKRFPDTDGWGYAEFNYDAVSRSFTAFGHGPAFAKSSCHQCHKQAERRDFVFTEYASR